MVRLEHSNLSVVDIEKTLDFILTAFPHWQVRARGNNVWYGVERQWLHVGDDDYYLSLNGQAAGKNRDLQGHTPGLAHLGFAVDDVNAIVERLTAKGYDIRVDMREGHPFRKTAYFIDPEGFEFEFIQYLSEKPEEKNLYEDVGSTVVTFVNPD
ncbi:glyoxalase [Endozoicomonas sp. OPT23]|uniref:VOC family protein n=1 Tax=Endozoicomonas sp. OPT23 TaxID=2072845 RepID=UPI00129A9E5A|nr:VOC family protein [Endozoicomonas sp. OPT23]MRI35139.1 glyoxalase [Endozoicomonas sp. OPT23]